MTYKRMLSDVERDHVCDERLAYERANWPGYTIEVRVAPETDDEGRPFVSIVTQRIS